MEILSKNIVRDLLVFKKISFNCPYGENDVISVIPIFDDSVRNARVTSYEVVGEDTDKNFPSFNKLISYLKTLGLSDGETVKIAHFENFDTYEEVREFCSFQDISLKEVLEKYPSADSFKLYYMYDSDDENEKIYITREEAEKGINSIYEDTKECIYNLYEAARLSKLKLPKFEAFFSDIVLESERLYEQFKTHCDVIEDYPIIHGMLDFFLDEPHQTSYDLKQTVIRNIYYAYMFYLIESEYIKSKISERKSGSASVLSRARFKALIPHLKSSALEIQDGEFVRSFLFELNDETKTWISSFKKELDMDPLYDLTLLKGEKPLFYYDSAEEKRYDALKVPKEIRF